MKFEGLKLDKTLGSVSYKGQTLPGATAQIQDQAASSRVTGTRTGAGAATGAAVGSFVPVVGTLAGGVVGAAVGGLGAKKKTHSAFVIVTGVDGSQVMVEFNAKKDTKDAVKFVNEVNKASTRHAGQVQATNSTQGETREASTLTGSRDTPSVGPSAHDQLAGARAELQAERAKTKEMKAYRAQLKAEGLNLWQVQKAMHDKFGK